MRTAITSSARPPASARRPLRSRLIVVVSLVAGAALPLSCVLGDDEPPGCVSDADCDQGVCRAGACFHTNTGLSEPNDPAEAGADASDSGDPDATDGDAAD